MPLKLITPKAASSVQQLLCFDLLLQLLRLLLVVSCKHLFGPPDCMHLSQHCAKRTHPAWRGWPLHVLAKVGELLDVLKRGLYICHVSLCTCAVPATPSGMGALGAVLRKVHAIWWAKA